MNKSELISIITNAKQSHKKWVENARSLVEGIPLDKNQIPVNATDCNFGRWYYGKGQALIKMASFKELEDQHDLLHQTYREIFVLLFGEEKKDQSFFSRLFGSSQKSSEKNHQLAKDKVVILVEQSKVVLKKLDELERMIYAMSEGQINSYINETE